MTIPLSPVYRVSEKDEEKEREKEREIRARPGARREERAKGVLETRHKVVIRRETRRINEKRDAGG